MTREPEHPPAPEPPGAPDEPHDVLAADEFPGPSREASIHEPPVQLPPEPDPSSEPHDVLAAEEFAMPAPRPGHELAPGTSSDVAAGDDASGGPAKKLGLLAGALAAGGAAFAVVRRLRAGKASKAERVRRRITRS